ncbi:MAG: hypothetical protein PGN13_13705 [Patulibacter minatonensis]
MWLRKSSEIDRKQLLFFGAHDYGEVEEAADAEKVTNAGTSNLARWMGRLPTNDKVWLPEIGVAAHGINNTRQYDEPARTRQADYLFKQIPAITTRNGATVVHGNSYQFCGGDSGFDTSLHGEFSPSDADQAPSCIQNSGGGTAPRREEVISALLTVNG